LITEFAAISLALRALGISPYISVPLSAVGLTLIVVTGSYRRWERIVIALCLMDLAWFVLAFMVHPNWATGGARPLRLCRRGCGNRLDSECAPAVGDHQRAGLRRADPAFCHHLSSITAQ
jgi:hypothetical protein